MTHIEFLDAVDDLDDAFDTGVITQLEWSVGYEELCDHFYNDQQRK